VQAIGRFAVQQPPWPWPWPFRLIEFELFEGDVPAREAVRSL
jgi:hypothetical protein